MQLPDWLARRAELTPQAPAIISAGQHWSFAELSIAAGRIAAGLLARGMKAGAPVALLLGNHPAFAAVVHAAPRCGALLVPLNLRLTADELAWQLENCDSHLLIYDAPRTTLAATFARPNLTLIAVEDLLTATIEPAPARPIDLDQAHTLIYTSGTTGRPKGALLSYGNHWWSATGSALNLGLQQADRWLAVLPLFHVGGLSILLRGVIYGIPVLIHERFEALAVNAAIEREQVTIISVVTTMLQRMLDERGSRPYPAHLRCVLLGGGPAPQPLLERCAALGVPVVQTYGMTETASQAATLAPAEALRKLGSAGKPLLPLELKIDAATGAIGEILVRGPTVTLGYYRNPTASAQALRDGWLHTGDLGYLDQEGFLFVVDRRDDLIISGGENVYPAEVEAILLAHPAVAEAGVIGVAEPTWGQVPVGFVVLRPETPLSAAELIAFASTRLARYKVPHAITFVKDLPRTAAGKLQRRKLHSTGENRV